MDEQPTVFVVDDDPAMLASVTRSLTKRGYKVEEYKTGEAFFNSFWPGARGLCRVGLWLARHERP